MKTIRSIGRAYWDFNAVVWCHLRHAAVPILVVIGLASAVAGYVGWRTDTAALMWAPTAYAWAWFAAVMLARR